MVLNRWIATAICTAVIGSAVAVNVMGQVAASMPAATQKAASTQAAATQRGAGEILMDLKMTGAKLQEVLPSPKLIGDAKFRKENGPKAIPTLQKMAALLGEFAATQTGEEKEGLETSRMQMLGVAMALGDADAAKQLNDAAASKDAKESLGAKSALTVGNWLLNSEDAKAQQKVLDDYAAIAKANPEDEGVAQTLMMMTRFGPANKEMSDKVTEVIRANLKGEMAKAMIAEIDAEKAKKDMEGKPLAFTGRTTTDAKFDSATLKGKVVMMDFWATWCGPCQEELPRVKALYKTYHDKGLEIVGIDCDDNDDVVNKFTKDNEMPWTQLREKSQGEADQWHPLAKQYKVDGIPTMFLIDKKGVLRYIDAREDTEEKIKKLLEEKE